MEKFRTIPSFPDYEVSNYGRVRTSSRMVRYTHSFTKEEHFRQTEERLLKVQYNKRTGYKFHQLYRDKKMYNKTIHSLVAEAFIKSEIGKDFINHKDGNKHNNTVKNLERCTNEYNHAHATATGLKAKGTDTGTSKLNEIAVCAIKRMLSDGIPHPKISQYFNISRPTVTMINTKKIWKHVMP